MATILIVEDNQNTQLLLKVRLKPHYNVICANNGKEALDIIQNKHIDLVVSDIMMPDMDGYNLLKTIRKENSLMPVLLITAKQGFDSKRKGFYLGTDDYMTKPINYEELVMRIDALLRRAKIANEKKIQVKDIVIDSSTYTIEYKNKTIELPKKEFDLLYKLLSYPGVIFSKNQLLDEIWGYSSESLDSTVKTHISRLRNRDIIKNCDYFKIVTVKGLGYKIDLEENKNGQ